MNYLITKWNRKFTLRTATNNDTGQIVELVKEILQEFNFVYSPESSEKDLFDIENTYTSNGGTFEIIENSNGQIIATVALLKINQETVKLRKMYVDKSYRGCGFGRIMLDRMILTAKELNFNEIILETAHNMKAAIHLYEKYGFQKIKGGKINSPRCDIIMKRKVII